MSEKSLTLKCPIHFRTGQKRRVEMKAGKKPEPTLTPVAAGRVKDMACANTLLDGVFLKQFNAKFRVKAAKTTNVHTKAPTRLKLDEVLCEREERAVGRDWCVQWRGRLLQIDQRHAGLDLPRPGRRVTVIAKACGDLVVRYAGETLRWVEILKRPQQAKEKKAKKPVKNNKRYVPGPEHPFNRIPACPGSHSGVRGHVGYASAALTPEP
jgi:hypothetical protein